MPEQPSGPEILGVKTFEELLAQRGLVQPTAPPGGGFPVEDALIAKAAPAPVSEPLKPAAGLFELLESRGISPEPLRGARTQALEQADVRALIERGVDVETGGPAGVRARLAITPPGRRRTVLEQSFPLGFTETEAGIVVNTPEGQLLLDEAGLSRGDFADAAAEGIVVAGAVGGAAAALIAAPALATGGVVSLALLALVTGISGQAGLTVAEVIAAYKAGGIDLSDPEDQKLLTDVVKRRGTAAAIDAGLDFLTAGTFRVGKAIAQRVAAPNLETLMRTPMRETLEAAERLDVPLSPGEQIGGAILRAEALAERVPAAAEPVRVLRRRTAAAVERVEAGLPQQDVARIGGELAESLEGQRLGRVAAVDALRRKAGAKIERALAEVGRTLSRRTLSLDEAGEAVRTRIKSRRLKFKDKQTELEDRLDGLIAALPEDERAFLPTNRLRGLATKLEKEFPQREVVEEVLGLDVTLEPVVTEVVKKEIIPELFPAAARNVLSGIRKLPAVITVEEARNIRQTISAMIDGASAFPGVSVGMLKAIEGELTATIRSGAKAAPTPRIGQALGEALDHFRQGVGEFRQRNVARLLLDETQPGFMEGSKILPALVLFNNIEAAKRIAQVAGPSSVEVRAAKRSVFDEMLRRSQDSLLGSGFIDPKLLARQFDNLSPDAKAFLFGGDVRRVRRLVRLLAAKHGFVDVSQVKAAPGERNVLSLLQQATKQEGETARLFDTRVLKPFLAGRMGASAPSPDEFVRFVLKGASTREIRQLFGLLSPKQIADFGDATVTHIIERSAATVADPEAQALALLSGRGAVGLRLAKVLQQDFGATVSESLEKIRSILPSDTIRILEDLALVQAARGQAAVSGKAVGGLVAGSVISGFLDLRVGTAVRLVKARIVARMMRSKPVRAWLTSRVALKPRPRAIAGFEVALPQILRAITSEVGEASPDAQAMHSFFTQDVPVMLGIPTKPTSEAPAPVGREGEEVIGVERVR